MIKINIKEKKKEKKKKHFMLNYCTHNNCHFIESTGFKMKKILLLYELIYFFLFYIISCDSFLECQLLLNSE